MTTGFIATELIITEEYWERLISSGLYQSAAYTKPAKWKFWDKPTPFLTWIDLSNGDGFKRERTLRILSGRAPNRFFFTKAVRRLNDWVPQVRAKKPWSVPDCAARLWCARLCGLKQ